MLQSILAGVFALLLIVSCSPREEQVDREIHFNKNRKFVRSDIPNGQELDLDDSGWRLLDLPHDYSIEDLPHGEEARIAGPFSDNSEGGASTGHVMGGAGWYRKHFTIEEADKGRIFRILFDGVYMNADFWINGKHLGNHPYGYTAFAYDLTEFLNPSGEDNVLAVQVKNEGKNSRWYSGSGIYRNVILLRTHPVHFDLWGVFVTTPEVTNNKALIQVEARIANYSGQSQSVHLRVQILDPGGEVVAESEIPIDLDQKEPTILETMEEVMNPELWSPETPSLYTLKIQLADNKTVLDETEERFGIRTIEFSPEKGFLLNGENVLLKGGCLHHDNGPLGAAAFETAEYRRVKIMKENGFNAIRAAHNPPSKAFLDACDELGILVIDESFDHWQRPKNDQDYHLYFDEWWERDMESMVLRDRNHPCIIIWSIGNEVNERADSSGVVIARNLKEKILTMDDTRPLTQAVCHFWDHPGRGWDDTAPAFEQMDVHGYNYRWTDYESDHDIYPERIIIGTETFPMEALENWEMAERHSYVIGDFVWTGMDYLGESGIGHTRLDNAPSSFLPGGSWFNAYCGDISILGYKKPQMYYRDVVWRNSELEMLVHAPVPDGRKEVLSSWGWPEEWKSWNWEGNEGIPLMVSVYSRCDQVRLELNGEVIGTRDIVRESPARVLNQLPGRSQEIVALAAKFDVPYEPGELVAVGLNDGKGVVRQSLKTAGDPAGIRVTAEQGTVKATGNDLAYFNIEVVDESGLLVPNATIPVDFEIQGNGTLQAVANGNPQDMKSFQEPRVNSFRGRCQVIVRSAEKEGEIKVLAKSDGLTTGEVTVQVRN